MASPAYCCPAKGPEGLCSPAAFALPKTLLDARGRKQYAAVTLLMRGDAYLPGATFGRKLQGGLNISPV